MTIIQIATKIASQPLSDRRDYGVSSDPFKTERSNEWKNTVDGERLLSNTYLLQDLAEGVESEEDLADLESVLKQISEQAISILEFVK